LDSRGFFKELSGKNIKSIYLGEAKTLLFILDFGKSEINNIIW
jgi:hypothetical protein